MEGIYKNDNSGGISEPLHAQEQLNNSDSLIGESDLESQDNGEGQLLKKINELPPMTRKEFLKGLLMMTSAVLLTACAPKPIQETLGYGAETKTPTPELEKYAFVSNPQRLNISDFIKGAGNFPSAIVERSPFAKNDRGEPLFLRYGGQFSEVTFLHSTGQKPPVVGEILPLMYKVPTNTSIKDIDVVPYAISTGSESKKVDLNDGRTHHVVPIVTSGTSKGIVQRIENGQVVNQAYQSFEVMPDSVSGSSRGFLSWAVLTEIGNEVVVEGVATSSSGVYIDPNSVPQEVSELMGN